jgi:hypothetical protein
MPNLNLRHICERSFYIFERLRARLASNLFLKMFKRATTKLYAFKKIRLGTKKNVEFMLSPFIHSTTL